MFDPDSVTYNMMFKGYNRNGQYKEVISLFGEMVKLGVKPSCYTFPVVLKSCGKLAVFFEGRQVHSVVTKSGFSANPFVGNTLIEMYSGAGECGQAYKVFDEMTLRNIVSWMSIINGFISCRRMEAARDLFDLAPERDLILWNTMVSGYIEMGDMESANNIFREMLHKDIMAWNTMLSGYANNGQIEACKKLFEEMPSRNIFSWNGLIGGYARHSRFLDVLTTFKSMLSESDVLPDDATLVTVLSVCSKLGALDTGRWLHLYAQRSGYKGNIFVENALVDMYAKCGQIESAISVFEDMIKKDLVSWNTIIGGLAMHGHASYALAFFTDMTNAGLEPDDITYVGVISACTHLGLVDKGLAYFQSMASYSIRPQIEHYGCLVDLYARAGHLHAALNVVNSMPVKPDAVIWACLLGASRIHKNVEIAEFALNQLIRLEPENPANYLMMSNIYGDSGNRVAVSKLKIAVNDISYRKMPGCSMIEVHGKVVEFHSLDNRHSNAVEIFSCLRGLTKLSQLLPCQPEDVELEQEAC